MLGAHGEAHMEPNCPVESRAAPFSALSGPTMEMGQPWLGGL